MTKGSGPLCASSDKPRHRRSAWVMLGRAYCERDAFTIFTARLRVPFVSEDGRIWRNASAFTLTVPAGVPPGPLDLGVARGPTGDLDTHCVPGCRNAGAYTAGSRLHFAPCSVTWDWDGAHVCPEPDRGGLVPLGRTGLLVHPPAPQRAEARSG